MKFRLSSLRPTFAFCVFSTVSGLTPPIHAQAAAPTTAGDPHAVSGSTAPSTSSTSTNPHAGMRTVAPGTSGANPHAGMRTVTPSGAVPHAAGTTEPHAANPHGGTNPHGGAGFGMGSPLQSAASPDAAVPPGSVIAEVVGPSGQRLPNIEVTLVESFESVAEGNATKERRARTDASGQVRFDQLDGALRYSYELRTNYQGARYQVPPFRAMDGQGTRAQLVVFPATNDLREAFVGMRGFVYVRLQEDSFQFEVLFRVFSMAQSTWIPKDVGIELPNGFRGIESEPNGDAHFVETPGGVRLEGSFPPGQRDVRLTFSVPSRNRASEEFRLTTLPHVAELRVLADAAPGVTMTVPGFEPPERTMGPSDSEVWITRRMAEAGAAHLPPVAIQLSGLPVVGPERWFAVALAALGALAALWFAIRSKGEKQKDEERADRVDAERLLLDDLVLLEAARERGDVGERTYEEAKQELLDALARLDLGVPSKAAPSTS